MNAAMTSPAQAALDFERQHRLLILVQRAVLSSLFGVGVLIVLLLAFALFPLVVLGYGMFRLVRAGKCLAR